MAELTSFAQMTTNLGNSEEVNTQQSATDTSTGQQSSETSNTQTAVTRGTSEENKGSEQSGQTVEKKDNETTFEISIGDQEATQKQEATTDTKATTFNLDEEIKKVDRKELAKKLGFTEFSIEMDEYLNKGGHAVDYLNAKSIDYNQISDEDILKADIRRQYTAANQKISSKQVDLLFERKYTLPEDAPEDDKELLDLQLRTDANNLRQSKITEQQKFKIPDTPILQKDEAYEQWKQVQESQPKLMEQARNYFTNHDATKTLNENKRVVINLGEGVEPLNFNIDKPELITQNLTDGGEIWGKLTSTATGEPDVPKQQLITLFAFNPQKFMQDIFKYGLQMGERKQVTEGQNAAKPQAKVATMTNNGQQSVTVKKFGDLAQ